MNKQLRGGFVLLLMLTIVGYVFVLVDDDAEARPHSVSTKCTKIKTAPVVGRHSRIMPNRNPKVVVKRCVKNNVRVYKIVANKRVEVWYLRALSRRLDKGPVLFCRKSTHRAVLWVSKHRTGKRWKTWIHKKKLRRERKGDNCRIRR